MTAFILSSVCLLLCACNNSQYNCNELNYAGLSQEERELVYRADSALIAYIHELNTCRDSIFYAHQLNDGEKAYNWAWRCVLIDDDYKEVIDLISGQLWHSYGYDSIKTWFPEQQVYLDAHMAEVDDAEWEYQHYLDRIYQIKQQALVDSLNDNEISF